VLVELIEREMIMNEVKENVIMTKWYERGEVGEMMRDILDYCDNETCIRKMEELGLSADEIHEVLMNELTVFAE
jgi:hypothetical protein